MTRQALAIGLASVVLALVSFLAVTGTARGGASVIASLSPLPTDGFALARQSSQVLVMAEVAAAKGGPAQDLQGKIKRGAAAARTAFLREPMSVEAIRNEALLREKLGDRSNQLPLMLLAGSLSRRDTGIDFWLAQHYGRQGEHQKMLRWLDYSLRTSTTASELIVPVLLKAASDPRVVSPLTALLTGDPPWADDLWNGIDGVEGSYANLARVRTRLHRAGTRLDARHDEKLLLILAEEGMFAEAEALAAAVPKRVHAGLKRDGELVVDPGFSGLPALPPFSWQLNRGSELDVYVDSGRKALHIGAFGDGAGTVARQLVKLPGSPVRVSLGLPPNVQVPAGRLFLSLECAEAEAKTQGQSMELSSSGTTGVLEGGRDGCAFYWLNVNVRPTTDRSAFEADLDSISVRAVDSAG